MPAVCKSKCTIPNFKEIMKKSNTVLCVKGFSRKYVIRNKTDDGTNDAYNISIVKNKGCAFGYFKSRIRTENPAASAIENEATKTEMYFIKVNDWIPKTVIL